MLAVRRRHTGQIVTVVVAYRDQEAVHAVVDRLAVFGRDQLRENRCDGRGFGGSADVVLAGRRGGGVDAVVFVSDNNFSCVQVTQFPQFAM